MWFVWWLSDFRTHRALASSRPKSLAEAEGIPGNGVVKLHADVPKFLNAISKRGGTAHRPQETGWSYFLCAGSSDQSPHASEGSELPALARWDGGIVASQFLISTWLST